MNRQPVHAIPSSPLPLLRLLAVAILVTACGAPSPAADGAPGGTDTAGPPGTAAAPSAPDAPRPAADGATAGHQPADTGRSALLARADSAVAAIARRDWSALAALVHAERGVRLTPYGHVEPAGECTVTLAPAQVAALGSDTTTRCWGHFDGSGEPIRLTFADYAKRFVNDREYQGARRGAPDERLGHGNTLSNVPEVFGPDATFVEYHVPGTEKYAGMDWGSLRLVFTPHQGRWRLVGIVHDQWTI